MQKCKIITGQIRKINLADTAWFWHIRTRSPIQTRGEGDVNCDAGLFSSYRVDVNIEIFNRLWKNLTLKIMDVGSRNPPWLWKVK